MGLCDDRRRMIYIRIEFWRKGDRENAELLHEGVIYNDGTGDKNNGNYRAYFSRKGGFGRKSDLPRLKMTGILRQGELKGFKRKLKSAWNLLGRLLPDEWLRV